MKQGCFPFSPSLLPVGITQPCCNDCLKNFQTLLKVRTLLTTISNLLAHHASTISSYVFAPDPILLAVGMHQPLNPRLELSKEEWEDLCQECGGWEWIDAEVDNEVGKGKEKVDRNEFGGR